MTRSILKVVLTTLALVLLFAGSFDLNRASAATASQGTPAPAPRNWCWEIAGCKGGPYLCAQIQFPDGTVISCFTEGVDIE